MVQEGNGGVGRGCQWGVPDFLDGQTKNRARERRHGGTSKVQIIIGTSLQKMLADVLFRFMGSWTSDSVSDGV